MDVTYSRLIKWERWILKKFAPRRRPSKSDKRRLTRYSFTAFARRALDWLLDQGIVAERGLSRFDLQPLPGTRQRALGVQNVTPELVVRGAGGCCVGGVSAQSRSTDTMPSRLARGFWERSAATPETRVRRAPGVGPVGWKMSRPAYCFRGARAR